MYDSIKEKLKAIFPKQDSVKISMKRYLANFDFDWSEFTLTKFIVWSSDTLSKQIVLIPCNLAPTICGAYLIGPNNHRLILFDQNLPPLLRSHTILHELAHLLCGHQTASLTDDEIKILIETDSPTIALPANVIHRQTSCKTDQQEEEAEALALLIQSRIQTAKRQRELMEPLIHTKLTSHWKAYI